MWVEVAAPEAGNSHQGWTRAGTEASRACLSWVQDHKSQPCNTSIQKDLNRMSPQEIVTSGQGRSGRRSIHSTATAG